MFVENNLHLNWGLDNYVNTEGHWTVSFVVQLAERVRIVTILMEEKLPELASSVPFIPTATHWFRLMRDLTSSLHEYWGNYFYQIARLRKTYCGARQTVFTYSFKSTGFSRYKSIILLVDDILTMFATRRTCSIGEANGVNRLAPSKAAT